MAEEKGNEEKFDFKAMNETMKQLAEGQKALANLPTVLGQMGQAINSLNAKMEGQTADPGKEKDNKPAPVGNEAIEDMSNTDLVEHILSQTKSAVEEALKPLSERMTAASDHTVTTEMKVQVVQAVKDHADFWEWKDDISALAKSHPTLAPEQLYQLARDGDEEKATEIDAKAAEAEAEGKETETKAPPFGGLMPTSGIATKEGKSDKSFSDAAEDAWSDMMKGTSSEAVGNA